MPPKKQKVSKEEQLIGKEADQLVLEYLNNQYRPYSIADIISNLHNQLSKQNALNSLETLAEQGEIITKTYGKLTYYVAKEKETKEEMEEISIDLIDELRKQCEIDDQELKELEYELQSVINSPSNEDIVFQIGQLEKQNAELEEKIKVLSLELKNTDINTNDLEKLKRNLEECKKVHKLRKKNFNDFKALLKENVEDYEKLMSKIGVEEVDDELD